MPIREIADLYNRHRFPIYSLGAITFLLYMPFGIVIVFLRIILGIQFFVFGYLLPDIPAIQNFLSKLLCSALGIIVYIEIPDRREKVSAYVSNYVSPFDHLVIHSLTGSVVPGKDIFNSLLSTAFGIHHFGSLSANFTTFKKNISASITAGTIPIHFQPECKQTNGKTVLKFTTWPFEICSRVQPICIEVFRPLIDIKVSVFDTTYWSDTFAYLFSPCTYYKIRFLPIVEKMDLTEVQFSDKVRQDIATSLGIELSEYSATDLLEWEKRMLVDIAQREIRLNRPSSNTHGMANTEINRMARQVKEVLPMVPYNSICSDLLRTRNVDQTITNILEGHVRYTPETLPSTSSTSSITRTITISNTNQSKQFTEKPISMAALSFAKSAHERMSSFQERKQQLIETARQRYIKKHGLNIQSSS